MREVTLVLVAWFDSIEVKELDFKVSFLFID